MAIRTASAATTFRVEGLNWGVIDTGHPSQDAPTLLLLPGTLGTAAIFSRQIAALREGARILSLDYPVEPNLVRIVDSLAALLEELGVETFHVLGTSLGGFAAQWLADRIPDRIETLFIGNSLVDPAPARSRLPPLDTMEAMSGEQHKEAILASLAAWPEPEPVFAQLKRELTASAEEIGGEGLKARMLALQRSGPVPPLVVAPERIVIIESADDPLIGPDVRASLRERYQGAEVESFETGGHCPYVTRAGEYTDIIRRRLFA